MTIHYQKKAPQNSQQSKSDTRTIVMDMLNTIRNKGEQAIIDYTLQFDKWDGDIIVSKEQIENAHTIVSPKLKQDIQFTHKQVKNFAEHQKNTLKECQVELSEGLTAGQKLIPMQAAGCYVPGGRYAHIASAIMSVTTAKVANVGSIIACSPAKPDRGIHPAILYALDLAGADCILNLGGVPAIASMAYGFFNQKPVDILVGPGNQFVAESKRILYGQTGIDMFAGPTEIAIIADETADVEIVAYDLVGQAEHGYNSPAWLITFDHKFGEAVNKRVLELIQTLPEPNKTNAESAWRDYGEIVVVSERQEAVKISDAYAAEHLEIHCKELDWWLDNLTNYGSLFLGEETTVAYGDKTSGTNHILPTMGAARYTGGLSVGKFMKTVTWQRMSKEANRQIGQVCARISRLEGMEAHARTADIRLEKYFPNETFDLKGD